ncbi:hypothetical protein ZWY2020_046411 [Hordeum vulgare]|nr:hypothetical protein ZWY2020_046411 [Hordeum vulgare]
MHKGRFESLQATLSKRLVDWSEKYASQASKEVLIKAVAQAIPVYVMSIFKLPYSVCDELTKLIRQYWWRVDKGKRKMAWMSWNKLLLPKSQGGLGFRDMRAYNQALLAKQMWRLLMSSNSLCASLLRAKYFPNGNLVDTVFTGNASAVWRGLEHGLQLVKKGMLWRVGNGMNIKVWRDPWIPRGMPFIPITPRRNCRLKRVHEFLNEQGGWRVDLLRQYFWHPDVEAILKIRTSARWDDFISWPWEKSGVLTVKSAYHVAMAFHYDQFNPGSASADPSGDRPLWKLTWDTKVPPKLKNFAWQVASGSLPTDAEKKRRHFDLNGFCQVCDREQESSFHALLACPHAANLWDTMRLYWPLPDRLHINYTGKEWLFNLLDEAQVSVRSRIIMVLWRSWYVRNEIVHGKTPPPQDVSSAFLQSYHNTFSQISSSVEDIIKGKSPVVPNLASPPCKAAPSLPWPRPPEGMVALSVDGSYAISDGSAGTGMILRKPSGEVIFAAYRKLFHCNDALEAELQAIHEGVKLAAERSEATIMLQSDCVTAINAITSVSLDFSAYGNMIREIKVLLSDRVFIPVKVSREQNRVADCLANYARCEDSTTCWLGHSPSFASDLVAKDCNSVIME